MICPDSRELQSHEPKLMSLASPAGVESSRYGVLGDFSAGNPPSSLGHTIVSDYYPPVGAGGESGGPQPVCLRNWRYSRPFGVTRTKSCSSVIRWWLLSTAKMALLSCGFGIDCCSVASKSAFVSGVFSVASHANTT